MKYAVHTTKNGDDKKLLKLYEKVGWKWQTGSAPLKSAGGPYSAIAFYDGFGHCPVSYYRNEGYTIITVAEAEQKLKAMYPEKFGISIPHIKPEVYKVGDMVEILENARECRRYEFWDNKKTQMIASGAFEIQGVHDDMYGISYDIYNKSESNHWVFPHYCVRKVEDSIKEMTIEQLEKELGYKIKVVGNENNLE